MGSEQRRKLQQTGIPGGMWTHAERRNVIWGILESMWTHAETSEYHRRCVGAGGKPKENMEEHVDTCGMSMEDTRKHVDTCGTSEYHRGAWVRAENPRRIWRSM